MPARLVSHASDARQEFENALRQQSKENAQQLAERVRAFLLPLFQRTLQYWNQSGENKFPLPSIVIETQLKPDSRGYRLTITATVRSQLWEYLDQGTPAITQRRQSPPIKERIAQRTIPQQLDVRPFPGFTGKRFVIRAGQRRKGIPARLWTRTIADMFLQMARANPDAMRGFTVQSIIVNGSRQQYG